MEFWSALEQIAKRRSVLAHPFYVRWSAGELSPKELADYAGQYRYAVVALADASAQAARDADGGAHEALAAHAAEEAEHVALWDDFINAVGGEHGAAPTEETQRCVAVWSGAAERPFLGTVVALYAIESAQPELSKTKLHGLAEHYGVKGRGAAYFKLHEQLDVEHADAARSLIEARLRDANESALLIEAERVLAANWQLLDGVERMAA
jgi:pyrroloquinoline-quinone synthase